MDRSNLHKYQEDLVTFIKSHPRCALFVDMGLGKTITTLTALTELPLPALIIAPKCVAENVWDAEAEQWEHTRNLRISKMTGTAGKRITAMKAQADIYILSRDNVAWFVKERAKHNAPRLKTLVIDELSSFKSPSSQRFKALRGMLSEFDNIIGLTGTPISNGYMDLWAQIYCIDEGKALGKYITHYRRNYFLPDKTNGHIVYSYKLRHGADEAIKERIAPFTIHLGANDYINMPSVMSSVVYTSMPEHAMKAYREFRKDKVLGNVTALTAATLLGKLLQISSGDVYDDEGKVTAIHTAKIDMLAELLECRSSPVIIAWLFKHEEEKIKNLLSSMKLRFSSPNIPGSVNAWNEGKLDALISHPASMAHGLNLQKGGHQIIWYSTPWSLELYDQLNARLARQGQTHPVTIQHIVTRGTFDINVINALKNKRVTQNDLLNALSDCI